MIRGRSFYAIWNEKTGLWSKDEGDVQDLIDEMIRKEGDRVREENQDMNVSLKLLRNFSTNKWSEWQKYCKAMPDRYKNLDEKMIFSNESVKKTDYVTKILPYPLKETDISAYDEVMDTLYAEKEREKLEWAIGAIIKGDSKKIQKFLVLYGAPKTGKSTILNIIQMLFPGFYSIFEAKELTGHGDFALESLKDNALIGIQHDGDLSRIEDNTRLNSIVSHEEMIINEKFKSKYTIRFQTFLFMGTNKPVKITDANSGIVRRLIDVTPTGNLIKRSRYDELMTKIPFELPGIAHHCLNVYEKLGYKYYDEYVPTFMIDATNDFYNFVVDNYELFDESRDGLSLKVAWRRYKEYCEDALIQYPMNMRYFKTELKSYFEEYYDRLEGQYSVYKGFVDSKFKGHVYVDSEASESVTDKVYEVAWLDLKKQPSILDDICKDCPAQYVKEDGTPKTGWDFVTTTLKEIDTSLLHYVRVPENHIVIDFDLKDENGEKSLEKNLEAAKKFPRTYAECSRSGNGLHLHYYYTGDPGLLSRIYDYDGVEVKVFTGKSALRRCLSKCNDIPIAEISSGLPLKEVSNTINEQTIKSERALRDLIKRNLKKEIHPFTKPSIDFIYDILEGAYKSDLSYNVTDLRPYVQQFALSSSHNSDYCLKMVSKMKFKSKEEEAPVNIVEKYEEDAPIVFFDVEVFPNVFIVCYKKIGEDSSVVRLINPTPEDIEKMTKWRLVGFNNRNYDNHMLYARMMGYSPKKLFVLNNRIIVENDRDAKFGEAYNLSYTDIYDYMSAANKMSLKKWEIKLHIHHQEFPYPWDEFLDESLWEMAADYCANDVIATEAVWNATQEDFRAREILAKWANMTVNDTTNSITTKLIVGDDPNPQRKFIYTDLSTIFPGYEFNEFGIDKNRYSDGVKIVKGQSIYLGKDPGEGGYAIGYPGIYYWVGVLDVESMHPHSIIKLKIWGEEYTLRYEDIVGARLYIKHGMYEEAKKCVPEDLHVYLNNPEGAEELNTALKTPINSAYGLTSAKFPNKLRDPRNKDNIVAKYGALFMMTLEQEVIKRGYTVVHIKTDSIKIENMDNEIRDFCMEFAKEYGFTFEHESTYSKIALMNDAVYIAKYASCEWCEAKYGYIPKKNKKNPGKWTATGAQFQVPYVFKTLFSKEPIDFWDLCETKSVTTRMYLDFNENLEGEDAHDYRFIGRVGLFTPVKPGYDGGILLRRGDNGKYSAVNGTKVAGSKTEVYRWMESEMAKTLPREAIDLRYYNHLVDEAVESIEKYGSFDEFVADEIDSSWIYAPNTDADAIPFDDFPMNKPR